MIQELIELKQSLLAGRYDEALLIMAEFEEMSKKGTLKAIKSYLVRLLVHLIKNQVEQRMNNSWFASIRDSILEMQDLNLKGNKTAYYINKEDWQEYLEIALEDAITTASIDTLNGKYNPFQLQTQIDSTKILETARQLLSLTYEQDEKELRGAIATFITQLPGGEDWKSGQSNNI